MAKLNIKELKENKDILMLMNEKVFEVLQHSNITISDEGISTNAGTTDDIAIPLRDSLLISALVVNMLLLVADKWDSFDSETKNFIETNLEMIVNFMKGSKNNEKNRYWKIKI